MQTVPTPDPEQSHPDVDTAEAALRCFGDDPISRETAAQLLGMWAHNPRLTDQQRRAVLERFAPAPVPPVPDHVAGGQVGTRHLERGDWDGDVGLVDELG